MPHFAKLNKNNLVTFVLVGRDEDEGKEVELSERTGDVYKQTSYNTSGGVHSLGGTPLRKNYAGIGFKYDSKLDAFISPKPFKSWKLDKLSCQWAPPIPYPGDGLMYSWSETIGNWEAVD